MFVYVVSCCGHYLEWEAGCWGSGNGLGPALPTYAYCHEKKADHQVWGLLPIEDHTHSAAVTRVYAPG